MKFTACKGKSMTRFKASLIAFLPLLLLLAIVPSIIPTILILSILIVIAIIGVAGLMIWFDFAYYTLSNRFLDSPGRAIVNLFAFKIKNGWTEIFPSLKYSIQTETNTKQYILY